MASHMPLLYDGGPYPSMVLDNLLVENSASVVLVSGGETIFEGKNTFHFKDFY